MDPNPKSFPILSYVMSRLHPNPNPPQTGTPDVDIEQPPPSDPQGGGDQLQLVEQMPHLNQPELLASMAHAVSDVAQTRSVLQALGERPDHEHVDAARTRIAEIEADLSRKLEEIVRTPRPDEVDRLRWREQLEEREKECRERGEREKYAYREVVRLEEMHEAYNKLLSDAEDRLAKIYGSAGEENEDPVIEAGEEVNEEVIGILREGAAGRCLERVELSGRQLRFIPEDFGKLRGLLVLNLSNNQLEAIPDSIAGLEHLEELRLSSNLLVSLPHSIGLLLNLKILDVSRNKLKSLPDSISHCRSLVELDASFNQLTYLPTNIGYELVNLQRLLVHLNKIRSLPTSISEMSSLRHLDAHFNELRGLPHSIGKLTDLETLDLSSNFSDMTELPETFGDLTDLRELDLSNNQIHALPNTFGRLDNLVKLNLDQNPLVLPPVEIVNRGVEAVKGYMAKRWLDILLEEEKKSVIEANSNQSPRYGWLTRSTSLLNSWASGVSGSVAGYLGTGEKQQPYKDPCLDQQF